MCSRFFWRFLLPCILTLPGAVLAKPVAITPDNISLFTLLRTGEKFVCYSHPEVGSRIGLIKGTVLRTGIKWKEVSTLPLERKIAKLERSLLRIQARKGRRKVRRKTLKLERLRAELQRIRYFEDQCVNGLNPPDFLGEASSLEPYREFLSRREVAHILDKVAFGGSAELERIGREQGLSALVNALVDGLGSSRDGASLESDAQFWASKAFFYFDDDPAYRGIRIWSALAAEIGQYYKFLFSRNPLHEWMLFTESAHVATNLNGVMFSYSKGYHTGIPEHWTVLKENAMGSFAELLKSMLKDAVMNFWLDNKDNWAGQPNQNWAREILELFALGAFDPITGEPNYGEESVVAATGFLSGYYEDGKADPETGEGVVSISFGDELRDHEPRTVFSGIPGAEATYSFRAEEFIDHVLYNHPGSARYLAERFGGQILYPGISEELVRPLAASLVSSGFNWRPFLKLVLRSSAMFSAEARTTCINSPVEHFVKLGRKMLRTPLSKEGDAGDINFFFLGSLIDSTRGAGQVAFEPPSVFGWKGACNINRSGNIARGEGWLTPQRLLNRSRACISMMNDITSMSYDFAGELLPSRSMSAEHVVDHLARELFSILLSDDERSLLARFLTNDKSPSGALVPLTLNLNDIYYVNRKLPRLICLLSEIFEANTK